MINPFIGLYDDSGTYGSYYFLKWFKHYNSQASTSNMFTTSLTFADDNTNIFALFRSYSESYLILAYVSGSTGEIT